MIDNIADEFVFNAEENSSFNKKNNYFQRLIILIALILFVLLISDWRYGISIGIFFCIIQFLKNNRRNRYFITHIELIRNHVIIKYTEEGEEKSLAGSKSEFIINKKIVFNRVKTPYLAIAQNGILQIRQFEIGEWTESTFDKVILLFQ